MNWGKKLKVKHLINRPALTYTAEAESRQSQKKKQELTLFPALQLEKCQKHFIVPVLINLYLILLNSLKLKNYVQLLPEYE